VTRLSDASLNRGLSDGFLSSLLNGTMAPLLHVAKAYDLDVQIREDYINLYCRGLSLLKLEHLSTGTYRAEIHVKFLAGVQLPGEMRRSKDYATFSAGGDFAQQYASQLAAISTNSRPYAKDEGSAEDGLVRNSLRARSDMAIIDRQLQLHHVSKRADVICLTSEDEPRFIIGEVKYGLNNDIQTIPDQLAPYYRMRTEADGRLTQNAAEVYRRVVEQKRCLSLLPDDIAFPAGRPRVECLAILCDYNRRSELLSRARAAARDCGFTIHVVQPSGPDYAVPPVAEWQRLCR